MSSPIKAYNELVSRILSEENREKFEWAVGAMLDDGPRNIVVLRGPSRSGKTVLLSIIRKILLSPVVARGYSPRVSLQDDAQFQDHGPDVFVFVATYRITFAVTDPIVVDTTDSRHPVTKFHGLIREIDNEIPAIADHCVGVYRSLGEDPYNTLRENI